MYGPVADEIMKKAKIKVQAGQSKAGVTRELLAVSTIYLWPFHWHRDKYIIVTAYMAALIEIYQRLCIVYSIVRINLVYPF